MSRTIAVGLILSVAAAGQCSPATLTTQFNTNNGQSGCMFDVVAVADVQQRVRQTAAVMGDGKLIRFGPRGGARTRVELYDRSADPLERSGSSLQDPPAGATPSFLNRQYTAKDTNIAQRCYQSDPSSP